MVIGVWLKVGGVKWLISIMSVDEHSADGAHNQDCVTQQEVSDSPRCFSLSDSTSQQCCHYGRSIPRLISAIFFFLSPRHFHTIWKRKVLVQFLFKSAVWIWMWHAKPELSVKHRNGSVFCFMEGRCHPRNCAAQENWQRLKKNTTTSVRAINAGKWASGHIVN